MTLVLFGVAVGVLLVAGLVLYWLLAVTEGAYLGQRVVAWLYDRGATTYDGVKQFDRIDEVSLLANPLFNRLAEGAGTYARVLDVATGTARLPAALFDLPDFGGTVVGVDLSRRMLVQAVAKTAPWADRCTFVHHPATPLPFADGSFDAVTMLEALEFLPDRALAVAELARVLAPGGWLVVTNRIGVDALLMPGRVDSPAAFEARLRALGLVAVETRAWMTYYGLVFARRPGETAPKRGPGRWFGGLVCPACGAVGAWGEREPTAVVCGGCDKEIRSTGRIWSVGA